MNPASELLEKGVFHYMLQVFYSADAGQLITHKEKNTSM